MSPTKYMMLLIAALTLGTAACSDDDDDNANSNQDKERMEGDKKVINLDDLSPEDKLKLDQQSAILSVIKTLTGQSTFGPLLDGGTYEPTYGTVLYDSQPFVRSYKSETVEEAEASFRSFVSGDSQFITTTADGLSISLRNLPLLADGGTLTLGTLTFHRGDGTQRMGYVDVEIPTMPHLERIDYIPPSAFPQNANTPYTKGMVVYYDGPTYAKGYYLCVQGSDNGAGLLVHLNEDEEYGQTRNLDNDKEGCYRPINQDHGMVANYDDVITYVSFLINNKKECKKIKEFFRSETKTRKPMHEGGMDDIFPNGFNNEDSEKGVVWKKENTWDDFWTGETVTSRHPAFIIYSADYGEYRIVPAYEWRICKYVRIPSGCTSLGDCLDQECKYTADDDYKQQVYNRGYCFAMNIIRFRDSVSGAAVEFNAMRDK